MMIKKSADASKPKIEIPTLPAYRLESDPAELDAILRGKTLLIGLDIGYGATKALAWGFTPVIFPTLYGYERSLGYEESRIMEEHKGDRITTDSGEFFVGNLAARHLPVRDQISMRGRDDVNDIRRLMMLAAIGKLLPGVTRKGLGSRPLVVRLAIGLPVSHLDTDGAALKEALTGEWEVFTDQSQFTVCVDYVSVMPQPSGTISAYSLLPDGEENPRYLFSKVAVVDNGKFSVDVATEEDGTFIRAESDTRETGMYTAFERIQARYEEEFKEVPPERKVEEILLGNGKFRAYGEPQDWSDFVEADLRPMRDATMKLCRDTIGRGVSYDAIFNVGGPAPLVKDQISREYRQAMMPPNSQTTNALGYLHYAAYAASLEE